MKKLMIIGAGGHGKVVADIAKHHDYENISFLDDNSTIKMCGKYPVIGNSSNIFDYKNDDFFIAIGNNEIRERIFELLQKENINIVTLVHPSAVIADDVTIGKGTVIMANVVVNPDAKIGKGVIVNTASSIDHECKIDNFTHVSVGAHIAGAVHVGANTFVGAGSTIINNMKIVDHCTIGAGAVVVSDLEQKGTYIGVPAKLYKEGE